MARSSTKGRGRNEMIRKKTCIWLWFFRLSLLLFLVLVCLYLPGFVPISAVNIACAICAVLAMVAVVLLW